MLINYQESKQCPTTPNTPNFDNNIVNYATYKPISSAPISNPVGWSLAGQLFMFVC